MNLIDNLYFFSITLFDALIIITALVFVVVIFGNVLK